MNSYALHHLAALEHEAIHILREVAAEFKNPVLMYSVGKDSSVLLHLAQNVVIDACIIVWALCTSG